MCLPADSDLCNALPVVSDTNHGRGEPSPPAFIAASQGSSSIGHAPTRRGPGGSVRPEARPGTAHSRRGAR